MSTDPIGAAFGRDDAAIAAHALQIAAEPSNELTGIATAIECVEALLAACGPAPEGADAIERIADIAFVLHERDVEASLCDALDAAVRELGNTNAAKQANVQHVRQAAELLRQLTHRVAEMIALLQVSPPPPAKDTAAGEAAPEEGEPATVEQQAREDTLDGEFPREGLFSAGLLENEEFARAVAELATSLPALTEPTEAVVVMLREPADLVADEPAPEPAPEEAVAEPQRESADLVADEPALAAELEQALSELQAELADVAADEPASAPEPEDAVAETRVESVEIAAVELAVPPARNEAVAEAQHEPVDLAAQEPAFAPELEEAVAEAPHEPVDLGASEPALTPELGEAVAEAPHEPVDLGASEPALAPEQQPPALGDEPTAIEQTPAEESSIALEEPKDEAITIADATQLSEGALSETLSGEALLESADAAPPPDLPVAPPDHALASVPEAVAPPDADAACVPSEMLAPLAPEEAPDHETALAPDSLQMAAPAAEPELPPQRETPPPPADITADITAEAPSDQSKARHNGGDGPAQITDESNRRDADDAVAETATQLNEEPAPRVMESSQSLLPELALVDPQDDPGDLFEPLAGEAPPIAEANGAAALCTSEFSAPAAAIQTRPAAAAGDPFAALRALSAEELLALFT
jgi:hypothetical protein